MKRADELREAIERAKARAAYAEKEVERWLRGGEITGERAARQYQKLKDDVTRARADVMVLTRELGREVGNIERLA